MNKRTVSILTGVVLCLSLTGLFYFGFRAVAENSPRDSRNPFAYDIESFKKTDTVPIGYTEAQRMTLALREVSGLAIGTDDRVYVSGDASVEILDRQGVSQSLLSVGARARCLAVGHDGLLYLGMTDHIEVYGSAGGLQARWESLGERALLTSLAVSEKEVFVADAGNRIVWKFDHAGRRLGRIGDKSEMGEVPGFVIPSPFFDVGLDPDGFLWVANTGRFSLENYNPDGTLRSFWGESSMEWKGFCGCCNPSHFTILADGSFVTAEKGIARVKVYDRLGRLSSVVAGPQEFQEGTVGLDLAKDTTERIYVLDPSLRLVRIFTKSSRR